MKMLLVVMIALFAGTAIGQNVYEDCTTQIQIVRGCKANTSVSGFDNADNALIMTNLDDLTYVFQHLSDICTKGEEEKTKNFYYCIFNDLQKCLADANSTTVGKVPNAGLISDGIYNLCMNKDNLNLTCSVGINPSDCEKETSNKDDCTIAQDLITCTEKVFSVCEGSDIWVNFVKQAQPSMCVSGARTLSALPHLIFVLIAAVFILKL